MSIKLRQLRDGRYEECRTCADDTAAEWLKQFQKDEPGGVFVLSNKRPPAAVAKKREKAPPSAASLRKRHDESVARAKRSIRRGG